MSSYYPTSHALIIHKGKLLFMLRDNSPFTPYPNTWGLLGGCREEGETPEQTLLRELEEEASLKPKDYQLLFKLPDMEKYIYLVRLSEDEVSQIKLGDEGQKLDFFTLDELENIELAKSLKERFPYYRNVLESVINPLLHSG